MPSSEQVKQRIKELLVRVLDLDASPHSISDEVDLRDAFNMDSIASLELLISLEEEFAIEIADDELTVELVSSVEGLAGFVQSKGSVNDFGA